MNNKIMIYIQWWRYDYCATPIADNSVYTSTSS